MTFKYLNGVYPKNNQLVHALKQLPWENSQDLSPQNIIVQGKTLVLIDQNDPDYFKLKPKHRYEWIKAGLVLNGTDFLDWHAKGVREFIKMKKLR